MLMCTRVLTNFTLSSLQDEHHWDPPQTLGSLHCLHRVPHPRGRPQRVHSVYQTVRRVRTHGRPAGTFTFTFTSVRILLLMLNADVSRDLDPSYPFTCLQFLCGRILAMSVCSLRLTRVVPWTDAVRACACIWRGVQANALTRFVGCRICPQPNYQGFASASQSGAPGGGQNGYQSGQAQPLAPQQHAHPAKAHDPDAAPF
jgi:hypothetical protein